MKYRKITIFILVFWMTLFGFNAQNSGSILAQSQNNATIVDICKYIMDDLGIEFYKNYKIEELVKILNISDDYTIEEYTVWNALHGGGDKTYINIHSEQYKIVIAYGSIIASIEIKINEKYSKLFPYSNISDYKNDKIFMERVSARDNYLHCYSSYNDFSLESCTLNFENGLLDSITLYCVWS